MNGWFGFWIGFFMLCIVFVLAEVYITMQGIDTMLWTFRTPPELELQQKLIEKAGGAK